MPISSRRHWRSWPCCCLPPRAPRLPHKPSAHFPRDVRRWLYTRGYHNAHTCPALPLSYMIWEGGKLSYMIWEGGNASCWSVYSWGVWVLPSHGRARTTVLVPLNLQRKEHREVKDQASRDAMGHRVVGHCSLHLPYTFPTLRRKNRDLWVLTGALFELYLWIKAKPNNGWVCGMFIIWYK